MHPSASSSKIIFLSSCFTFRLHIKKKRYVGVKSCWKNKQTRSWMNACGAVKTTEAPFVCDLLPQVESGRLRSAPTTCAKVTPSLQTHTVKNFWLWNQSPDGPQTCRWHFVTPRRAPPHRSGRFYETNMSKKEEIIFIFPRKWCIKTPTGLVDFWPGLWCRYPSPAANGALMIMLPQHCTYTQTHIIDGRKSFRSYYNSCPQLDREPFCRKMTLYAMFRPFASAMNRAITHSLVTSSLTDRTAL